ncbi:MAG: amino acid adenylation protein [Mucilaginibacter sp.]|nr:amino acid adenylation protein [Mucilaginibacter sp.]
MSERYKKILGFIFKQPVATTLIDLFEEQVINSPNKIALVYKTEQLSYRKLNERVNQFAHYLRQKGVKEETLVPIYLARSIEMIVAILGILKAGGAFVPIDPNYPSQRAQFILEDIGVSLVVTNIECKTKLLSEAGERDIISIDGDRHIIDKMPKNNLANKVEPHHLAYIIYTSGSTGNPKGVMVEHKSIYNYLLNSREKFINKEQNGSGTFIHIPYTFDASLKSIFTPLVSGKLAVISSKPSPLVFEDSNLHKYAPYDFIQLTPAHLDFFYAEFKDQYGKAITGKISIGGEALYLSHFNCLTEKGDALEVVNEYGPTETTVACTGYHFHAGRDANVPKSIPIGKPINNVHIHILNRDLKPVISGEEGEICVAGVQVARGYLNQPELTNAKFIQDPINNADGARIYKTGDIGRWLPNGNIEYVGRSDNQVKIRGHRVELGEIESILIGSDLIKNAVVATLENKQGDKQLIAYIVPFGVFDKQKVSAYLKDKLPHYLIPEKLVELKYLPLTSNGKIDRKSLPVQE